MRSWLPTRRPYEAWQTRWQAYQEAHPDLAARFEQALQRANCPTAGRPTSPI
jgi:hypothetical protein